MIKIEKQQLILLFNKVFASTLFLFLIDVIIEPNGSAFYFNQSKTGLSIRIILLIILFLLSTIKALFAIKKTNSNESILGLWFFATLFVVFVVFKLSINTLGFELPFNSFKPIISAIVLLYCLFVVRLSTIEKKAVFCFANIVSVILSIACISFYIIGKIKGISFIFDLSNRINIFLNYRVLIPRYNGGGIFSDYLTIILFSLFASSVSFIKTSKIKHLLLSILFLFVIMQSMSRTFYIFLIILFSFLILFFIKTKNKKAHKKSTILLFCFLLALFVVLGLVFGMQRFGYLNSEPGTDKRQTDLMNMFNYLLNKRIVIGYGFGATEIITGNTFIEVEPLQILFEIGVAGMIFVVMFALKILKNATKLEIKEFDKILFVGFCLSMFFGSFFNPMFFNAKGMGVTIICFCFFCDSSENAKIVQATS